MKLILDSDPLAVAVVDSIRNGDTKKLQRMLDEKAYLARSFIHDKQKDVKRSLLHIATDWPGHFPNVGQVIKLLYAAGSIVNVGINGPNTETPLHWAASSNDLNAIDALLDCEADLNAQGAVIAGGDPLEDAIGFQNWQAACRLVERGATTNLGDEAALGLIDRMKKRFEVETPPSRDSIVYSFWNACCAGQLESAKFLFTKDPDINWIPGWCKESPLDGAIKSENESLITWLVSIGATRNISQ